MSKKKNNNDNMRADDFLAYLATNSEYQAMRKRKDAEWAAAVAKNRQEEATLVQELRDAGVHVKLTNIPGEEHEGPPKSVWDLVNTRTPYPEAIPILIKHLEIDYGRDVKEGIIRALAVVEARDVATERLIKEFVSIEDPDSDFKWVVGLAIAATTTPKTGGEVAALALDKSHGKSRGELPLGMLNANPEEAIPCLQKMLEDPVTKKNAAKALKRIEKL
jgi:hypothetical protein